MCHPPGSGSSVFSLSSFGWAANNSLTGVNDNGITRSYTYEDFNRLASSTRVSTPTNYTYDRFGNRYTAGSQNVSFDANNHVASGNGVTYDAAGNTTSEVVGVTTYSYTYDAENRLITFSNGSSSSYVYDALGRRAKRTVSGTGTEYLYDLSGRAISELATSGGGLNRTELYAGALHFATYVASSTFFAYSDWQGTERVRTDSSANVAEYCEWTPWGEFSSCTSGYSYTDPTVLSTHNYAGYERDSETGLDHMWYRYNDSRYGRFMTTEPLAPKQCSPRTLDLYTYVQADPVNFVDLDGLRATSSIWTRPANPGHLMGVTSYIYYPGVSPTPSSFCGTNTVVLVDGFSVSPDFYCRRVPFQDGSMDFIDSGKQPTCSGRISKTPIMFNLCADYDQDFQDAWTCNEGGDRDCCIDLETKYTNECLHRGRGTPDYGRYRAYTNNNMYGSFEANCCKLKPKK